MLKGINRGDNGVLVDTSTEPRDDVWSLYSPPINPLLHRRPGTNHTPGPGKSAANQDVTALPAEALDDRIHESSNNTDFYRGLLSLRALL